jgi:hypothetical protein
VGAAPPRRLKWPLVVGILVIDAVVGGIGITGYALSQRHSAAPVTQQPTSTSHPVPPVASNALEGLLLSVNQLNTALATSGLAVTQTLTNILDDSSGVSDQACLPLDGVAESTVYATSGWSAVRRQQVSDRRNHGAQQAVLLFPTTAAANAFFTASSRSWPFCANRQFTETLAGKPEVHKVGPRRTRHRSSDRRQSGDGTRLFKAIRARRSSSPRWQPR